MTKEEYLEIEDEIQDINFKIYECTIELKGLKRFLDYLQNVYAKTDENAEAIETTKKAIEKKETYIRLLKKEQSYYQDYALYYLEFEDEEVKKNEGI